MPRRPTLARTRLQGLHSLCVAVAVVGCHPVAAAPPARHASDLKLRLAIEDQESSMDSNSQSYVWTLDGRTLTYDYSYGGYSPEPVRPVHVRITLTDAQRDRLVDLLHRDHLLASASLDGPSWSGSGTRTRCDLEATLDGKSAKIHVAGWTNTFPSPHAGVTIASAPLFVAVQDLRDLLGDFVDAARGR